MAIKVTTQNVAKVVTLSKPKSETSIRKLTKKDLHCIFDGAMWAQFLIEEKKEIIMLLLMN